MYKRQVLEGAIHSAALRHRLSEECVHLDCGDERVFLSRIPLEMIFRNLVDNAIKYSAEDIRVEVKVRRMARRKIAIRISDNGPGIPRNMQRKVFQRFVRLGNELERRRKGTGLGLYIVRMCIQQLQGDIRIRDNKKGPGTSFYVLLPLKQK